MEGDGEDKRDEPAERSEAGSIGCVSRQSRRRIEDGWTNSYLMPTGVGIVLAKPAHIFKMDNILVDRKYVQMVPGCHLLNWSHQVDRL